VRNVAGERILGLPCQAVRPRGLVLLPVPPPVARGDRAATSLDGFEYTEDHAVVDASGGSHAADLSSRGIVGRLRRSCRWRVMASSGRRWD
jgi:hypothetical protein